MPSTPIYAPASLTALAERVAVGDRPALRQLYDTLRDPAHDEVRRTLSGNGAVRAVLHATFVEVWWMARFHTTAGDDIAAWVLGIAARRSAERRQASSASARPDHDDETSRLSFERLLGEPLRGPAGVRDEAVNRQPAGGA